MDEQLTNQVIDQETRAVVDEFNIRLADSDIEINDGSYGNDRLLGYSGDGVLYGIDDNDLLIGGNGDDFLHGEITGTKFCAVVRGTIR